jgi:hypothetical protein
MLQRLGMGAGGGEVRIDRVRAAAHADGERLRARRQGLRGERDRQQGGAEYGQLAARTGGHRASSGDQVHGFSVRVDQQKSQA